MYRFIVENSHIGIFVIDNGFHVIYANNEMANIVGYSLDEIVGSDFRDYLTRDSREIIADRYVRRQSGERLPQRYEVEFFRKDGALRTVEISVAVNENLADNVLTVVQVFDITERKRIAAELKQSEERYRTILQNMEDFYFELDSSGNMTFWNDAVVRNIGYSEEELQGMNFRTYIHPDDCDAVYAFFNKIFRTQKIGKDLQYRVRRRDGSIVFFETTCTIIANSAGNPTGFRGVSRDITERKQAENILRESEQRLRDIIDGSPIPTFVINDNHRITHWNEACEKLTGLKADGVVGTDSHWKSFYPHRRPLLADLVLDEASKATFAKYYGKKCKISKIVTGAYEGELFFQQLGKKGTWLFLTAAPLKNSEGKITGAIETMLDISEKKQAERDLLKVHDALEEKVKERTQSLQESNVALEVLLKKRERDRHDVEEQVMSNMREVISPYIERLKNSSLKEKQKVYLNVIERNLKEITAPFMRGLNVTFHKLTPTEIQVINLIQQDKKTKEIANFLGISPRTVEYHRDNIRNKFGIQNQKINLRSYLLSIR